MCMAAILGVVAAALASPELASAILDNPRQTLSLLAALLLITAVGFVDDCLDLRARTKLVGQVAATLVVVLGGGIAVESVGCFGVEVALGPCAAPLTILWLLVCVNALNLIDGMDGLLGTVAGIVLLALAIIALMSGQTFAAIAALALTGAALGFLWFNRPSATVYAGDAGSMALGLAVGVLTLLVPLGGPANVPLFLPVAILVLPLFDLTAAVTRRALTGRGLAVPDRAHLHHVLQRRGRSPWRVLALVAALSLFCCAGAVAGMALGSGIPALLAATATVVGLVATKTFGYAEFLLVRGLFISRRLREMPAPQPVPTANAALNLVDWVAEN